MKDFGELCTKYANRNLMEELEWSANYTRKGYMTTEYEDYYRWLSYSAYYTIKKLEEKVQTYEEFAPWYLRGGSEEKQYSVGQELEEGE